MRIQCAQCNARFKIREDVVSKVKNFRCPKCGHRQTLKSAITNVASPALTRMVCPKCDFEQPKSQSCINCGIIIDKYERRMRDPASFGGDAARDDLQDPQAGAPAEDGFDSTIQRAFMERVFQYAADNLKGLLITVGIVLVVSFFLGGVPLLSVLMGAEDEVMYFTQTMHCDQTKRYHIDAALYRIVLGNTGEEAQDRIEINLYDVPCQFDQVYYTLTNLSATDPRENDPVVRLICDNGHYYDIWRFVATSFDGPCGVFPQFRAMTFAEGIEPDMIDDMAYETNPEVHGFMAFCLLDNDPDQTIEILNLAPGTLLHIGFVTYDYRNIKKDPWQDMNKIVTTFDGAGNIIKGNPQATTLAKLFNALF